MTKRSWWQGVRESRIYGFALFLLRRFNEIRVPQVSASLTFTTLLALVPVFTVTFVVVSAFPMFSELSASFINLINSVLVPEGAETILDYIDEFKGKASSLTAIGTIMLVVTSLLLTQTIDQTFNRIWQVRTQRPLWMQILVYWSLLTLGPIAIGVSVSTWSFLLKNSSLTEQYLVLGNALRVLMSIGFTTCILWLLYRLVPNRFVPAIHALIGAAVTAVLLELARFGFTLYVGHFNSYTLIYGAFAAIPVFLIWLNLLWMLVITGAVITSTLSYWEGNAFRRKLGFTGRFDDVLKILLLLYEAQQNGRTMKVQHFRQHINMGYDELGDLLEKLARHGYAYSGRQGWVLKTNAEHIELDDLFNLFVYRPSLNSKNHVNAAVAHIMQPCLETMNITLAEFSTQAQHQLDQSQQDKQSTDNTQ